VFTKLGIEDIKEGCQTAGIGCVECKRRLADALNEYLDPIRERREAILKKPGIIDEVLEDGAKRARVLAEATLTDVRQAMRI
jgi:tryptophanyl-tRNA synthetase